MKHLIFAQSRDFKRGSRPVAVFSVSRASGTAELSPRLIYVSCFCFVCMNLKRDDSPVVGLRVDSLAIHQARVPAGTPAPGLLSRVVNRLPLNVRNSDV